MTEETIFVTALEKATPADRFAYLSEACGGDEKLRQRVEALLGSHEAAGAFLNQPAFEQIVARAPAMVAVTEADVPSSRGDQAKDKTGETQTETSRDDRPVLDFLTPSQKPGSLGRLEHYEILEVIGKGAFGIVLKAYDEALQRIVAIKVLAPQYAGDGKARKRFIRESRAAAAIRNDHVINIYAVAENARVPYLVMEIIDGASLQERIDGSGPMLVKEILRIGMQAACGLAAAHVQGLVHRDIKPANILLENGVERVKITDFGLARAVDDASLTQSGVVTGTPQYMAPEQAAAESVDHRADLFSLGSVMYAMCTGHPPFRASGTMAVLKRVCEDTPRPIREVNPDIPDWLCNIISKLHAKKPAERFQAAQEVADLLGQHLAHEQQPTQVPLPPPVQPPLLQQPGEAWPVTRVEAAPQLTTPQVPDKREQRLLALFMIPFISAIVIAPFSQEIAAFLMCTALFMFSAGLSIVWVRMMLKPAHWTTNPPRSWRRKLIATTVSLPLHVFMLAMLVAMACGSTYVLVTILQSWLNPDPNIVPFVAKEERGTMTLTFGNWSVVFEGVAAPAAGPEYRGSLNYPSAGDNRGADSAFDGQMRIHQEWNEQVNNVSVNDYTFKLLGKADKLVFADHTYTASPSDWPQTIIVAKDGQTRSENSLSFTVREKNGTALLAFGKWTLIFERVPFKGGPAGGSFWYPKAGSRPGDLVRASGPQGTYGTVCINQVLTEQANEITVEGENAVEAYRFKLLDKGTRLVFADRTYTAGEKVQTLIISADGKVRLGPPGDEQARASDFAQLQGLWRIVSQERAGVVEERKRNVFWLQFSGDRFRYIAAQGAAPQGEWKFLLDPAASPKQIDAFAIGSAEYSWAGIYRLEGDTLTLCIPVGNAKEATRPLAFATGGTKHVLTVCKRAQSGAVKSDPATALVPHPEPAPSVTETPDGKMTQSGALLIERLGEFEVFFPRPFAERPASFASDTSPASAGPINFDMLQYTAKGFKVNIKAWSQPSRLNWRASGRPLKPKQTLFTQSGSVPVRDLQHGAQFQVTYAKAYAQPPHLQLGSVAGSIGYILGEQTATGFKVRVTHVPGGNAAEGPQLPWRAVGLLPEEDTSR
jgi:uncharacterized protein (TIGR03067 family)